MKILFATSEAIPLIKTGGLADVSGALPAALRRIGVDARLLLPGYPKVMEGLTGLRPAAEFYGWDVFPWARLLAGEMPDGTPVFVIDCPELYRRAGGPYVDTHGKDWPDNARRFGLLSRIAAALASDNTPLGWRPDVLHCNDWQTGLAPAYLKLAGSGTPSVITVHNLAFQGNYGRDVLPQLGLPWESYQPEGVEFYGQLSFLKAGLHYADRITTVSPTYAREIQGETLGFGLQGLLRHRSQDLVGILNGIDMEEWDPSADHYLAARFDADDLGGKAACKRALQQRVGLDQDGQAMLFGLVGRFTHQKGIDVVLSAAPQLLDSAHVQLVMLGSGDADMQAAARALGERYPGRVSVTVGFDEGLSHQIEAGVDAFLMPSRFEPCGLNQMYSQRYGTPPIVHATGGLVDSVVDCNARTLEDGSASGFVFGDMSADTLAWTMRRALETYLDPVQWRRLVGNAMRKDFGWETSAERYRELYRGLVA